MKRRIGLFVGLCLLIVLGGCRTFEGLCEDGIAVSQALRGNEEPSRYASRD